MTQPWVFYLEANMNDKPFKELDNTKIQLKMLGKIKVLEVEDNEDGSAKIIFDVDQSFINNYKQLFNLAEWDQAHFEKTISQAIKKSVEERERRNEQDPDFLWSLPKGEE